MSCPRSKRSKRRAREVLHKVLLRYGGMRTFSAALPFFYGLILGQFIPGSLLNIWGIVTQNPTYQFWQ